MLRLPLLLAVALLAAASGDTIVERLACAGAFGRGYFDVNQSGVVPALAGGAALALEFAVVRIIAVLRVRRAGEHGPRLRDTVRALGKRSLLRDLPAIFALQLVVIDAMENLEAALARAPLPGPTAWLGGPPAVTLVVFLVVCVLVALALDAVLHAFVAACASLVARVLETVIATFAGESPACRIERDHAALPRSSAPHTRERGLRAPPFSVAARA